MKNRHLPLSLLTLGALAAVVLALVWFISDDSARQVLATGSSPNGLSEPRLPNRPPASAEQPERGGDSVSAPMPHAPGVAASPAGVDPFAPALSDAELLRTERRMFQAQTWEVDLGKALDLRPGERLERRSGLYRLAGGGELVRLDRVYQLGGARPAVVAKAAMQGAPAPAPALAVAVDPTGPLDAGGGKLVWANAMVADHLMVQVESGVTRERLAASLPALAHVGKQVTAGGLYLVEVPAEGERSVERAVLALNQIKGVVKFAEPDFALTSSDVTANDPLFTANAADLTKQWHLAKIRAPRAWNVLTGPPFPPAHPQYNTRLNQTVVAVVDTGIDYTHPDLAPNMWTNPGETGGGKDTNNLDDDGNGKIDDSRGWDFIDNDNDPMDDVGHGTHVAGIIGAVGNNATGGSGVCWNVKLLNLRIIKAQGTGTIGYYSGAIAAMDYLHALNSLGRQVAVANHSWGGAGYSLAMLNIVNNPLASTDPLPAGITGTYATDVNQFTIAGGAAELAKIKVGMKVNGTGIPIANSTAGDTLVTIIAGTTITLTNYTISAGTGAALTFSNPFRPKPYGVVHVSAAGNSRQNADRIPTYPAALPSGMMVSVGASDVNDAVALWAGTAGSNYGKLNVDLFAPGSSVWSTYWKPAAATPPAGYIAVPGSSTQGYVALNGTSMAAPQVAAAVALIRMWQPALTDFQARQVLIDQVEPLAGLKDKCISGGRLNVARMMDKIYAPALLSSGGGTSGTGIAAIPLSGASGITGLISAGGTMTLAVKDGKVLVWGENTLYSFGSTTPAESATPIEVPGLDNVVAVAAGQYTCYAIKTDGSVWAWGDNRDGQLGTDYIGGWSETPTQIQTLTEIISVSSTGSHTMAVRADGTVWAWGPNSSGQLGDGTTTARSTPVQVLGLTDVIMAEAGSSHSIALRADGTVWCWGARGGAAANALGDGALSGQSLVPIQVPNLTDVSLVDAALGVSLALRADGTVWEWGNRYPGGSNVPVQRPGLEHIILATVAYQSAMAMDSDGRVFGWGPGTYGVLGNASFGSVALYSELSNPNDQPIVAMTLGTQTCYFRTLDGAVYATGTNYRGLLGVGTVPTKYYPVMLPTLSHIANIAFGASSSGTGGYAVDTAGRIFRWGKSVANFQLPPRSFESTTPKETSFMGGANRIQISNAACCLFTKGDGTLWGWGTNSDGQLGTGDKNGTNTPIQIFVGGPVADFSGSRYSDATFGGNFVASVLVNGSLKMCGKNTYGQLGDGTTSERLTPTTVPGLATVTNVALGAAHSLALLADGTVWAWGFNNRGQLGDGTTSGSTIPKKVNSLSGIVAIAAVGPASFALKQDGTLWAWGAPGPYPYLGFPSAVDVKTPTRVPGLPSITAVSVCGGSVVALASDHTVWAWAEYLRLLGRGATSSIQPSTPAQVVGLSSIVAILAGDPASYAIKADGTVWAWGTNTGDGTDKTSTPVAVLGFAGASETISSLGTADTAASWQFQNFSVPELLDDSLVADSADPDRDGVSNLMEYALGLNPRQNDHLGLPASRVDLIGTNAQSESAGQIQLFSLTTADLAGGKHYQALTVNRNGIRQDIDYLVEVSADLQNWMSGDPFTITVLDTAETLEVYDATAMEDAPKRFMRLRIQRK